MPGTYTNRVGKSVETSFSIAEYLQFIVDNPSMRLHRPPAQNDQPSVAKHFGLDYEQQAQLRESPEYKAEAEAFAAANQVDIKDLAVKGEVKPRESDGINKSDKLAIGEKIALKLEELAPAREDGKEGKATTEWLNANTDNIIALIDNSISTGALVITEMDEKPAPKTPAETKAQLKEDANKKKEALAGAIKALAASGLDAATIASSIPNIEEADVAAILEGSTEESE